MKSPDRQAPWRFGVWIGAVVVLTVGFVWFCKAKTEGDWRWRWGSRAEKQ